MNTSSGETPPEKVLSTTGTESTQAAELTTPFDSVCGSIGSESVLIQTVPSLQVPQAAVLPHTRLLTLNDQLLQAKGHYDLESMGAKRS